MEVIQNDTIYITKLKISYILGFIIQSFEKAIQKKKILKNKFNL